MPFLRLVSLTLLLAGGIVSGDCAFPDDLRTLKMFPQETMGFGELARAYVAYDGGTTTLKRTVHERADVTSPWTKQATTHSVSFLLTTVAYRDGGRVLYVCGLSERGCVDVIEEWTFAPQVGERTLTMTSPVLPIGIPSPGFSLGAGVGGGGSFVPVTDRDPASAPRRREIYRGDLGRIRSSAVDPEGRFLLVQSHADGTVRRIELGAVPSAPMPFLSPSEAPGVVDTNTIQIVHQDGIDGRIYYLAEWRGTVEHAGVPRVVLRDLENDGIIDAVHETFGSEDWLAGPYRKSKFKAYVFEATYP